MNQSTTQSIPVWKRTMPGCEELIASATAPEPAEEYVYWASLRVCSHIFASIANYDANTGHSVPQSLQQALLTLANEMKGEAPWVMEDNLLRAIDLCHEPLETILAKPRSQLRRMHALRPVSRVREMDTRCMIWLARRPGRTAREKTVMNRRILGVQRERSSNTLENQVARRVLHELRPPDQSAACFY